MPEPVSLSLIYVVNALASGQMPSPDAVLSAAASILEIMLDRESDTVEAVNQINATVNQINATVNRIEDKVDRKSFTEKFRAGVRFLGEAKWAIDRACKGEDREFYRRAALSDLDKARDRFIDALSSTDNLPEREMWRAMVNWNLAMVYLIMGERERPRYVRALREAYSDVGDAFKALRRKQERFTETERFAELNKFNDMIWLALYNSTVPPGLEVRATGSGGELQAASRTDRISGKDDPLDLILGRKPPYTRSTRDLSRSTP